ncbi:MAG: MFS transporter [Candidatus Marinimicrobia bacterium]|nr:MFS transporter [Candidatus Neomarinimicrobiota bacterium]
MNSVTRHNIFYLWLAQTISAAGDAVYHIGLMWLILDITGSSVATGLVAMSAYIPAMFFGLYAGVLVDKHKRMSLMILANISQAATVILIPVLIYLGHEQALLFGVLAFVRASFGTLFPPSLNAFIPEIVEEKHLLRVNSIISTSQQFAWFMGPALAGIMLNWISIDTLFMADAGSFIIAIIVLRFVKKPKLEQIKPEHHSTFKELVNGLRYVADHPFLGFLLVITIINNMFIMGPALVGMPILVKDVFSGGISDYALVESFMALGMLAGSLFVYLFGNRFSSGVLLLVGMVLDGLTYSMFYWVTNIHAAWIFIFLHGIGIPLITVSRTALIQKHSPNSYHGRMFSMVHLSVVGVTAISSALVGIIATVVEINVIFFWIGIGAALCGVIGWMHPKMRHH